MKKRVNKVNFISFVIGITAILMGFISISCKKSNGSSILKSDSSFTLTSMAILSDTLLEAYKCEQKVNGVENSLPVAWSNAPKTAKAFAMTMVDYPNPKDSINLNCNLVLWGIPDTTTSIAYGKMNKGPWFIGPNKDGVACSYTSPCSKGTGDKQYILKIYALTGTPSSLPTQNSLSVNYQVFRQALSTVTIIDSATLIFYSASH